MAVMGFIYFGILHDRFDVEKYNRKQRRKRLEADGQPSIESISDNLSGIIMLTATAIYLLCGFVWGNWHPSWVVFPIGGLLCAILESVLKLRTAHTRPPAAPDAIRRIGGGEAGVSPAGSIRTPLRWRCKNTRVPEKGGARVLFCAGAAYW